ARQRADARTLLDETAMLAAAEAGGGELPRQFKLPTVERADDFGVRPHLTITSAEGTGDAIDLGWFEGEPLVGQPRALAGFAARAEGAAIVFATEQDERLRALLDESGVETALVGVDLDIDLDVKPGLLHSSIDPAAGCSQPAIGLHIATDAELFGRVRRPSRGRSVARTRTEAMTRAVTLDVVPDEPAAPSDDGTGPSTGQT